jgi:hypothetical protein
MWCLLILLWHDQTLFCNSAIIQCSVSLLSLWMLVSVWLSPLNGSQVSHSVWTNWFLELLDSVVCCALILHTIRRKTMFTTIKKRKQGQKKWYHPPLSPTHIQEKIEKHRKKIIRSVMYGITENCKLYRFVHFTYGLSLDCCVGF